MKCRKVMILAIAAMAPFNLFAINANDNPQLSQALALNTGPNASLTQASLLLPSDLGGLHNKSSRETATRKQHGQDATTNASSSTNNHDDVSANGVNTATSTALTPLPTNDVGEDNHGLALLAALGLVLVQLRRKHKLLQLRSLSGRFGLYA